MSSEVAVIPEDKEERSGSKNLLILAIAAVLIAVATTMTGVYLYVSSGDIYLDRSLPGLLPEETEADEGRNEQYVFNDYGPMNKGVVDEFLKYFDAAESEVEAFAEPFSDKPLSDENLIHIPDDTIE